MQLLLEWFNTVETSVICRDMAHLDEFAPDQLRQIAAKYPDHGSSTVYHFGYDEEAARFRGWAYRSLSQFASDELPYGIGTKPPVTFEKFEALPEAFIEITKQQRREDQERPVEERVGIGGEILFFVMEPTHSLFQICHRFEDYDQCYRDALRNLRRESIDRI